MNFEKNGQQRPEKNRQEDQRDDRKSVDDPKVDDDVKLTALALGEISDLEEVNRLKALLVQDDGRRKEYETTAHLASMIRDSVENDLPLAPGSIHDVVVAALEHPSTADLKSDPISDNLTSKSVSDKDPQNDSAGIVVTQTSQTWWSANRRVVSYASSLSILGIALAMFLYFQDWSGKPENIARYESNAPTSEAMESDEAESLMIGKGENDADSMYIKSWEGTDSGGTEANLSLNNPLKLVEDRDGLPGGKEGSVKKIDNLKTDNESIKYNLDDAKVKNVDEMQKEFDGKATESTLEKQTSRSYKSASKGPPGSAGSEAGESFRQRNRSLPFSSENRSSADKPAGKSPADSSSNSASAGSGDPSGGAPSSGISPKGKSAKDPMPSSAKLGSGSGGGGGNLGGGGFGGGGRGSASRGGRAGGKPEPGNLGRGMGAGDSARGIIQPSSNPSRNSGRTNKPNTTKPKDNKSPGDASKGEFRRAEGQGISGAAQRQQGKEIQLKRLKTLGDNTARPSSDTGKGAGIKQGSTRYGDASRQEVQKQNPKNTPASPSKRESVDKFNDSSVDRSKMELQKDSRKSDLNNYKKDIKSISKETKKAKPDFQNAPEQFGGEGKLLKKAVLGGTSPKQQSPSVESGQRNQFGGSKTDKKMAGEKSPSPKPISLSGEGQAKNFAAPKVGQGGSAKSEESTDTESDESKKREARLRIIEDEKSLKLPETDGGEPAEKPGKKLELKKSFGVEMEDIEDAAVEIQQIDPSLENRFIQPIGTNALSTFSIDTDTASYTNIRQMLRSGRLPHPEDVRVEEMVNYFDFKYEQPKANERFSVKMELASSPWSPGNKILKIGLQARNVSNEERPPSNLVFLVDVSGSMRKKNKLPLLKSGLKKMVGKLREDDYVSVISYANQIQVRLEPTDGSQKEKINKVIDGLVAGGGTNGGEGLQTAYRLAEENLLKNGTNRIVLGTDGDFNIGIQNDRELGMFVKKKAESGVFLTVCGFGTDNFQDQKMQTMSQNGNGKVYYIDSDTESQRVFADEISGNLVTVAKNVKLQLLFNPRTVQSYRLIGYENRMLAAQDFDNDKKDAGEINAGDSVTALYEIVPGDGDFTFPTATSAKEPIDLKYQTIQMEKVELTKVASTDDIAALRIRFIPPNATESTLREFVVKNKEMHFNRASREFQLSTAVAGLGMMLRGSRHRGGLNYENLKEFGQTVLADRPKSKRGSKDQPAATKFAENMTEIKKRQAQREEVLELINRAADLFQRANRK